MPPACRAVRTTWTACGLTCPLTPPLPRPPCQDDVDAGAEVGDVYESAGMTGDHHQPTINAADIAMHPYWLRFGSSEIEAW